MLIQIKIIFSFMDHILNKIAYFHVNIKNFLQNLEGKFIKKQ